MLHGIAYQQTLAILMYHGVTLPEIPMRDWCFIDFSRFVQQMKYLKKYFDVLSISEALQALRRGAIQRPTAVLTFDDGYQNTFDLIVPVLKHLRLPATIFLCTDLVDSSETVWFCRLLEAFSETPRQSLDWKGRRIPLATASARIAAAGALQEELKRLSPLQLKDEMRELAMSLQYDIERPIERSSPFRILDSASIRSMAATGLIEFGAHTGSHAILSKLPLEEKRSEIARSVRAVGSLTGHGCDYFAYPNGTRNDYDVDSINCLREMEIRAAFTTVQEPNTVNTSSLELRRYGIGSNISMAEFQFSVHHLRALYQRWTHSNQPGDPESAHLPLSVA
jgi:peptidoglycan/xylan/chitin deacetylase (PgdA/CDA1 family)